MAKAQDYILELEAMVQQILLPIYNKYLISQGKNPCNIKRLLVESRKPELPALLKKKHVNQNIIANKLQEGHERTTYRGTKRYSS